MTLSGALVIFSFLDTLQVISPVMFHNYTLLLTLHDRVAAVIEARARSTLWGSFEHVAL